MESGSALKVSPPGSITSYASMVYFPSGIESMSFEPSKLQSELPSEFLTAISAGTPAGSPVTVMEREPRIDSYSTLAMAVDGGTR